MKPLKKRILSAVLGAAVLMPVLAGCSTAGSGETLKPNPYVETAVVSDGPDQADKIDRGSILWDEKDGLILPDGILEGVVEEISEEEIDEISRAVAEMEADYRATGDPAVTERSWRRYTSRTVKDKLTTGQAELYDRLETLCRRYISNDSLDGVKNTQISAYVTDSVQYSDLSLSEAQMTSTVHWFIYNNPQYYFLSGGYLFSSKSVSLYLYEYAASAKKRAEITNELFDKLDGWIDSVDDSGATTWQKELAANNLLCKNITYNHDAVEKMDQGNSQEVVFCQSLYTSVLLGNTVCTGYAKAFCAMMNAMDVDTLVVDNPNHAWNVACFDDGNYYTIDVCWNDNEDDDDNPYNRYFNVGEKGTYSSDMARTSHLYGDKITLLAPAIPAQDYAPTAGDIGYDPIQLAAPTNVQVYKREAHAVCYSWEQAAGVDTYECARFTDESHDVISGIGPITGEAVMWDELAPDTTYYFGIRSMKTDGDRQYYSEWVYISAATAK